MKVDPGVERAVDYLDRAVVVGLAPGAEHHRAEAEGADLHTRVSEGAQLHAGERTDAGSAG